MPSSIASFDEFAARLALAIAGMDELAQSLPGDPACISVQRQLAALREWTRGGRRPTQDEKDRLNFGLIASRELDSCASDELLQSLYELNSYIIYWE